MTSSSPPPWRRPIRPETRSSRSLGASGANVMSQPAGIFVPAISDSTVVRTKEEYSSGGTDFETSQSSTASFAEPVANATKKTLHRARCIEGPRAKRRRILIQLFDKTPICTGSYSTCQGVLHQSHYQEVGSRRPP